VIGKVEQSKNRLIQYFTQSLSLSLSDRVQFEGNECSLQYLLGDMFRRNLRLFS
jgi:hypothetical protein